MSNQGYQGPKAALNHVGSYQVSGVPYASGSIVIPQTSNTILLEFPAITKEIVISNNGANPIRVGFSHFGTLGSHGNNNWFTVAVNGSLTMGVKVDRIFMAGVGGASAADVFAAMTHIDTDYMAKNGGANHWSGSVGVG